MSAGAISILGNQPGHPEVNTCFSSKGERHCTLPGVLELRKWGKSHRASGYTKTKAAQRQNHAWRSSPATHSHSISRGNPIL